MQIKFTTEPTGDAIAYLAYEGKKGPELGEATPADGKAALTRAAGAAKFKGGAGQTVELLSPSFADADRVLLAGAGKNDSADQLSWNKVGAALVKRLATSGAKSLSVVGAPDNHAAAAIAFGARLAAYRFDGYRPNLKDDKKPTLATVTVVVPDAAKAKSAYAALAARAEGVETARDLVSEPPNVLHPESYADRIAKLESLGLEIEILKAADMKKLGMHSLLGVGLGSQHESRLCVMKWSGAKDKKAKPLALVGKGVTFDTGGISIKPGPGMEDMKGDMGGSAAVVGTMVALAKRKAKANVVGIVGLVENMPDAKAQRPGDIVKSAAGRTIEIQNTDAEGRLVLVDALWYAQEKHDPAAIIDLATLTGAILIALGQENAGLFSNNDKLSEQLAASGKTAGETVWRLPLAPAYDKLLDSQFADVKNIGGRNAGSITAAQFLQRWIDKDRPWAHLDIAGTAWKTGNDDAMEPSWATGWGVRLLDQFVADNYED